MPGKYSHNVVLASYSSQGIIDLPNNDQACYVKNYPYRRAASAAAPRRRASSNATAATGHQSLGRTSVQSVATPSQPRRYGLSLGDTPQSHGRVIIAASDSEDDHRLHHQGSRSAAGSYHAATGLRAPSVTRNPYAEATPRRRRPADDPTRAMPPKASDRAKTVRSRGHESTASLSPFLERRSGVRAFMQARHLKEIGNEPMRAERNGTNHDARPITMKELLASGKQGGKIAAGHSRDASEMSVANFLKMTSVSTADSATTPEDLTPAPHYVPRRQISAANKGTMLVQDSTAPARLKRVESASGSNARRPRTHDTLPDDYDLDFDGFSDDVENNRFESAFKQPSKSARLARSNVDQEQSRNSANGQHKSNPANASTARLDPRSCPQTGPAVSQRRQLGSISPDLCLPREQPPARQTPAYRNEAQSRTGHSQQDSVTSSQSRSQPSSVFGLSSTTQTTVVGSRDSPASRLRSKAGTPHSWGLPRLEQDEPMNDAFASMFDDKISQTAIFTSDEEEDDSEDEDISTSGCQIVDEEAIYSSKRFGTISSGRDVTAKDRDVISEMSAAFPPDIGRFKYDEEDSKPLAASKRYQAAEARPEVKEPIPQDKTKKSPGGGLLGRLKMKRAR